MSRLLILHWASAEARRPHCWPSSPRGATEGRLKIRTGDQWPHGGRHGPWEGGAGARRGSPTLRREQQMAPPAQGPWALSGSARSQLAHTTRGGSRTLPGGPAARAPPNTVSRQLPGAQTCRSRSAPSPYFPPTAMAPARRAALRALAAALVLLLAQTGWLACTLLSPATPLPGLCMRSPPMLARPLHEPRSPPPTTRPAPRARARPQAPPPRAPAAQPRRRWAAASSPWATTRPTRCLSRIQRAQLSPTTATATRSRARACWGPRARACATPRSPAAGPSSRARL